VADMELRFAARFDEEWWEADLAHSSSAGQHAAEEARSEYEETANREILLRFLAFRVRHYPPDSHAETVYQIAHRRLNH
jgi:hypothetical protein